MRILAGVLSLYSYRYPAVLVYMLQSTEYEVTAYVSWYFRTSNFSKVMQRRTLNRTKAARLLLAVLYMGVSVQILTALALIIFGFYKDNIAWIESGLGLLLLYPIMWAFLLTVPLILGRIFISDPAKKRLIKESAVIFANHPGIKIAVAGSYGKTTMKELLATVLGESLNVAATPANKNVSTSHAYFAQKLNGKEDVLIIEYGEGAPGDVAKFAAITHPTHAIITGLAPAHLDKYKTLAAAGRDIFSVADYLQGKNIFVNGESPELQPFLKPAYNIFSNNGAMGWKVKDVNVGLEGVRFTLLKGKRSLAIKSGLIGRHQIGFLSLVAALSLELGLSVEAVQRGIAKTRPFEHRMQPYSLSGAWIIDDTYNGNLEGIKAGTKLLAELELPHQVKSRKIYVTPGLVDQGEETEPVHVMVGKFIASAKPDIVVLMRNSVTAYIERGLSQAGYGGELRIETDPLNFYTNLNQFVAAGDIMLMQNDWTDNYA